VNIRDGLWCNRGILKQKKFETELFSVGIFQRIRVVAHKHPSLANGAGIMDLANRVGHATPSSMILKVYTHLVEEMKSKQAFEIPKITFPTEPKTARKQVQKSGTLEKAVESTRKGVTLN